MKRTTSTLAAIAVFVILAVSMSYCVRIVNAQSFEISNVKHTISLLYNGYIIINDTITATNTANEFLVGMPAEYGAYVMRGIATSGTESFPVTLNVPFENRVGFYGARITFPASAIPQEFSMIFILTNDLLTQDKANITRFTLDFPTFPSLTEPVGTCNASISLPTNIKYLSGSVSGFSYSKTDLPAFASLPGNVTLLVPNNEFQKFAIKQMSRQIKVDQFDNIGGTDTYSIVSLVASTFKLSFVEVNVPLNATAIGAQDQFGRALTTPSVVNQTLGRYRITFADALYQNISLTFSVTYGLPGEIYEPVQSGISNYALNVSVFENINGFAEQATAGFTLPEGAEVTSLQNIGKDYGMSKTAFQESISLAKENVLPLDKMVVEISYDYNPLWASFRPTMWMWAITMIGLVVVLLWQRPKASSPVVTVPKMAVRASSDFIRSFVDEYEEKVKIYTEIDRLEERAEKGKIPRRRYKVQKRTLEARLDTLSRDLASHVDRMKSSGGHYYDLMVQLEVAESEIKEVSANVRVAEAQHDSGELSLEAHRKKMADYERKRQNSEATINGILLRLREEIG